MTPNMKDYAWRGMFRDLRREHGFEPLRVEGTLPPDLRGALYRCGPAQFSIGGEPYLHWFDADGAVSAVRIENGAARGAVRTVETRWLRAERKANRQLYRSYAQMGRGWRRWLTLPKNPANISVMSWNGQLMTLWEAGLPISIDTETLGASGETNLAGRIGPTFSAHPHRVGETLFNFGVRYGRRFSIDVYALAGDVRRITNIPLPRPTLIHDFVVTQKHVVFFCAPVRLRLARLLAGVGSFDENLSWEPQHGVEVIVVPLSTPDRPVRFGVDPFFQWHFVNAWDERDGTLVVDFLPYEDFTTNAWFGRAPYDPPVPPPRSRYTRARIDLGRRTMTSEVLSAMSCEFPAIHPGSPGNEHQETWVLDFDLPPRLGRFRPKDGSFTPVPLGEQTVPSEPAVVARPGSSSGWVLSLVYDGLRDASYVAVIDGSTPERGPVARLWFDHGIPFPFHGTWTAA